MPMKKKTTLYNSDKKGSVNKTVAKGSKPGPSRQTLDFIRRFAYSYHVESKLPQGMQEIIIG